MKNRQNLLFIILVQLVFFSFSSPVLAHYLLDGLEWHDPNQWWDGGEVGNSCTPPTSSDEAYLNYGRTSWVASSGCVAYKFKIGTGSQGGSLFTVRSGDLHVYAAFNMVDHTGESDVFELRGGTFTVSSGGLWLKNENSIFRIIGSDGTLGGPGETEAHIEGRLEFVVDANGITPIPWYVDIDSCQAVISIESNGADLGVYQLFSGPNTEEGEAIQDWYQVNLEAIDPGNGLYWDTSNLWTDGTVELKAACWATMPSPANGVENVDTSAILSWDAPAEECNPDPVYDIYFGTDPNFPSGPVTTGLTSTSYDPCGATNLDFDTTYYWKVDVVEGDDANEAIWSFTTESLKAMNPSPADDANGVVPEVLLTWDPPAAVSNPTYDVYLDGPNTTDTLVASGITDNSFDPDPDLPFSKQYTWRIDIHENGNTLTGDNWTFTTKDPAQKVLEWKLDASSGTVVEDTVGDADGTAYNDPNWVDGLDGNSLQFNDNGDYVKELNATNVPVLAEDSWSINMYLFLDEPLAHWTILGGFGYPDGDGFRYLLMMNDQIAFANKSSYYKSSAGFDVGWWQMLTATYDGSTVKIYKNGRKIGSDTIVLHEAWPQVWLSPEDFWGLGHLDGKIDEFTIWDTDLTQGEIDALADLVPVKGDFDEDRDVDMEDLAAFVSSWLDNEPDCVVGSIAGDFNGDCKVDFADFVEIANNWMSNSL